MITTYKLQEIPRRILGIQDQDCCKLAVFELFSVHMSSLQHSHNIDFRTSLDMVTIKSNLTAWCSASGPPNPITLRQPNPTSLAAGSINHVQVVVNGTIPGHDYKFDFPDPIGVYENIWGRPSFVLSTFNEVSFDMKQKAVYSLGCASRAQQRMWMNFWPEVVNGMVESVNIAHSCVEHNKDLCFE